MKRKKYNNELTLKEKIAAALIAAMCVSVSVAAFFIHEKLANATEADVPLPEHVNTPATTSAAPSAPEKLRDSPGFPSANLLSASLPEENPPPEKRWNVVFVIDDAGNNLRELEPFLRFPGDITISVLPGLQHSVQVARMVREAGKTLFLHQPMEALGGEEPGPGAIYKGMSADEVRAVLEANIREIGPVAGMNNHQGSLITEDEEIMKTVLEFCRDNRFYFLDSRTSPGSVAPKVSRELGMTIATRNIFLDNERDAASIINYMEQGLSIARERNTVVMIGHAWSTELAGIITRSYSSLSEQGYNFSTVADIMRGGQ